LQRAFRKGRLSADELERRVERALAARTRGELAALTRDLPLGWYARRRRLWRAFWRAVLRPWRLGRLRRRRR
jgi:hypothetical protein